MKKMKKAEAHLNYLKAEAHLSRAIGICFDEEVLGRILRRFN